jgi:hypothetical protein
MRTAPGCLTSGQPTSGAAVEDPLDCADREPGSQQAYSSVIELWDSGRRLEAVQALEAALERSGGSAQDWLSVGKMYGVLSTDAAPDSAEIDPFLQKAVAALKQAIALDPHGTAAYRALAELYGGRDARLAVAVLEAAAESDPVEYRDELERAQAAAAAATYALARLNVFVLPSAHEPLQAGVLGTEFHFEPCRIASVVIHTCMSGNNRQSAHGWLFESAEPDLHRDRPVAELAISSSGDVSVRAGCPADYDALKERLATGEMTNASLASGALSLTNRLPQGVELGEAANDPRAAGRVEARPHSARSKRLRAFVGGATVLLFLGATLISLDHKRGWEPGPDRTAAASVVYPVVEANRSDEAVPAIVSPPADLPPTSPDRARLPAPRHASAVPDAGRSAKERARSPSAAASQAATKRRPAKVATARGPVAKSGATTPPASTPPATAHGASTASATVVEQAAKIPRERVALHTGAANRFDKELQETCTQTSFLPREICKERLRWSRCHPDKWDQLPECRVRRSEFAP